VARSCSTSCAAAARVAFDHGKLEARRIENRLVPLALELRRPREQPPGTGRISSNDVSESADEQGARIADTGRVEVLLDSPPDVVCERGSRVPVTDVLGQLRAQRDRVQPVVRRHGPRHLVVQGGDTACLVEAADGDGDGDGDGHGVLVGLAHAR
jgi:hypothetical protein